MKITTHHPLVTQDLTNYVTHGLDGEDYDSGLFEAAERGVVNAHAAIGRILELLATKGLVSAPEVTYVVDGFEDEDAKFTDD